VQRKSSSVPIWARVPSVLQPWLRETDSTRVYLFYDIAVLLNAKSTASTAVRSCPSPPLSCVSVPLIVALSGGVCYELTVKVKMVASPVASGVSFVDFSA
jgi:hypothetical protein